MQNEYNKWEDEKGEEARFVKWEEQTSQRGLGRRHVLRRCK